MRTPPSARMGSKRQSDVTAMFNLILIFFAVASGAMIRYLSQAPTLWCITLAILVVLAFSSLLMSKIIGKFPYAMCFVYLVFYLLPATIIFFVTYLTTSFAIAVPELVPTSDVAEKKVVVGVLMGALNALVAAAILDAAKDPESKFWPGGMYKNALASYFRGEPRAQEPDSALNWAIYGDRTKNNEAKGWSFKSRLKRAEIISNELA